MYKREILEPALSPVKDGTFVEGTWNRAFRDVDLLGTHKPYSIPLPRWAREGRLKEWESFVVQNNRYHLDAFLANLKYFRIAQLVLYDKESGERFRFRKILPLSGWRLPRNLYNDSIDSRSQRFFFRIHNWLDAETIRIDIDVEARRKRPAFTCQLTFNAASVPQVTAWRRNDLPFYTYKIVSSVSGDMVWNGKHIVFRPEETSGFFRDNKGFCRYLSSFLWCTAAGIDENNRHYGFSLVGQSAGNSSKNNENAFWIGGKTTPLPPVRITMPNGIGESWVIQDLEGMVDLSFSPRVKVRSAFNFLVFSADYQTPLGHFSGFLLNSEGERIQIRGLWGLGEKLSLRV
ncbi:MAG: DUF2804 domain-containing protein [Treponema sp.]|jgi:hypothetical protein|nr:DUF2804 domain-containing protein [Treponema sp.]